MNFYDLLLAIHSSKGKCSIIYSSGGAEYKVQNIISFDNGNIIKLDFNVTRNKIERKIDLSLIEMTEKFKFLNSIEFSSLGERENKKLIMCLLGDDSNIKLDFETRNDVTIQDRLNAYYSRSF